MSEHDKIIDKIKKCLALSASSNEHEAAAALRQAKKLMEAHRITEDDVRAADVEDHRAKSSAIAYPSIWESILAGRIADAFGCRIVFRPGFLNKGEWHFIGCASAPEIALYAFTVLCRQAKRARAEHIKTRLKRCRAAIKTRRADLFCEGWVRSVAGTIAAFQGSEEQEAAIDAFMAKNFPALRTLKSRNRNDGRKLRDHEYDDYWAGHRSGKDARLNRGVGGTEAAGLLGG